MGKILRPTKAVIIVGLNCGFAATLRKRYRCLKSADRGGNGRNLLCSVLWVRPLAQLGPCGQDGFGRGEAAAQPPARGGALEPLSHPRVMSVSTAEK